MRYFFTAVLFFFVFTLASQVTAGNHIPQSPLIKNNIKEYPTLKSERGRMDEKTGIYRYRYNLYEPEYSGSAEQIARSYLKDHYKEYGIDPLGNTLKTIRVRQTPGGFHVFFRQVVNNIPVYDGKMVVTLNPHKAVTFVASHYRPTIKKLDLTAKVTADEAIRIAYNYLQVSGKLLGEKKAELVWFESKDRGTELCWRVSLPTEKPMGDWEVLVNAIDGHISNVKDLEMFHSGKGLIFNPDPLTTAGVDYGGAYKDNNDADSDVLNDQRVEVVLRDITYENGLYKLKGPYAVLTDEEGPTDNFPELADSSAFRYTRHQQEFEDVMVYYHIDRSTRHLILDLGYDEPKQHEFKVDPHGLNGDDNSHYMSSSNYCAFGEGGVDDGEDADVIWHEHAHSFQTNLTGGMSYSGETMSLQEGSSDYWAASYSRITNDFHWGYVFNWDGHNEFWAGRRCDLDWVYPDDYVSGHDGGQIWSSALMDIWTDLGRYITDRLFIETHYIWGYSPGLQDAAQAYIQADRNLYGGEHLSVIVDHFAAHGLVDKSDYIADIQHTPLKDTDDYSHDYPVIATITPGPSPLDTTKLWVIWGVDSPSDTLNMHATGNPDEYQADIPASGNNVTITYYIAVVDQDSQVTYDPANAPDSVFSFHVGPDTVNPTIEHTALGDQMIDNWPATVTATVTDNFGVDTVICYYSINNDSLNKSFPLLTNGDDTYSGDFPENVAVNDSVFYRIKAIDISSNQNQSESPANGSYAFKIIQSKGKILIVNDDPSSKTATLDDKGGYERSKDSYGKSASTMASYLNDLGYETVTVTVAAALDSDFTHYDLIISSSGANQSPVSDANYRTKLENWVSDSTHKLLIEGGEVAYDAIKSPGYSSFAQNVLHAQNWRGDNAGALNLITNYSQHPLVTEPNALPTAMSINYGSYGDQDAADPIAPAYVVYGTNSYASSLGILVYDPDADTTSAQTVYYGFNFDVMSDQTVAKQLLENTVAYLLADRARGVIEGYVDLTDSQDDSGVQVYLSGDKSDTTVTDASGYYAFTKLGRGTYSVSAYKENYNVSPESVDNISVNQDTVSNVNFTLTPKTSAIRSKNGLPLTFDIEQNYPNPFNPTTTIRYQLPKSARVTLTVFNTSGAKINTLISGWQTAGYHSVIWNGKNARGQKVASGIYIYHFKAGSFQKVKKMILLK